MSVSIIRGTNDKPVASQELAALMAECDDISGHLFIGYPIVNTPTGPHHVDALLVSPDRGLVIFDLVEGTTPGDYQTRQDDSANTLDGKLKTHRRLMERRQLRVPIHTLSFAPAVQAAYVGVDDRDYPLADRADLVTKLHSFEWSRPERHVYEAVLSALENVSAIRQSRTKRTVTQEDSRGARLKRLEESIATLDATQGRAVIETVDGVQRIRGLAGSGKTIVLALKAAYLHAQHPDWRIAVTFNTRSLKGHFRRLITNFSINQTGAEPDWDNLRIVNAWGARGGSDRDGLYWEFCRTHDIDYLDFGSARQRFRGREFSGVCEHALGQFRRSEGRHPRYDAILVDEAQDLPDAFLQICLELLRDPRRLAYAYDELQNLVGESVSSPETMFGTDEDGMPRVRFDGDEGEDDARDLILDKCYRNSRPVLVTAHTLGFGIYRKPSDETDPGLVQMFDNPRLWEEIGYRCRHGELRDGQQVNLYRPSATSPTFLEDHSTLDDLIQFVTFRTKAEQTEWAATEIRNDLTTGELRHDDIVVINPDPITTRGEVGPLRARLLELGINSHVAGVDTSSDEFFNEHADSVTFSGVHRAKGNEAGMVYVINAQDCYGGKRNVGRIRNRLFVAITRSKAWVRVLGIGSRMAKLRAEYDQLMSRDFSLQFTYPFEEERQRMRIVHRDMTSAERRVAQERGRDLGKLVDDLEAGRVHVDDLNEGLVEKLRTYLGG